MLKSARIFQIQSKSAPDAAAALHATTSLCERGHARTCVAKPRPILDPILGSRNVTKTGFAESGTADCIATHSEIIRTLLVRAYSSFCVVCLRCCMKSVSMSTQHFCKDLQDLQQANSATGTRTRVARVRAEHPNQLDYSGDVSISRLYVYRCKFSPGR